MITTVAGSSSSTSARRRSRTNGSCASFREAPLGLRLVDTRRFGSGGVYLGYAAGGAKGVKRPAGLTLRPAQYDD